jgi:hypothetical protein
VVGDAQASKVGTQRWNSAQTSGSSSGMRAWVSSFAAAMRASWMSLSQRPAASATRPAMVAPRRHLATSTSISGTGTPRYSRGALW